MGDESAPMGSDEGATTISHAPIPTSESSNGRAAAARLARNAKLDAARTARRSTPAVTETATSAPPAEEKSPAPKAEPAVVAAPASEPDDATKRGIESIEKRDKRQREQLAQERAAFKAEMDTQRTNLEKLRAEAAKPTPLDELKKMPLRERALAALKQAGIDPDDEDASDVLARDLYARSKSGKADPKNKQYADQIAEKRHGDDRVAQLERQLEELRSGLTEREQREADESYQRTYVDGAVKALPATPSLAGRSHTNNPERARAEMLHVARDLAKDLGEAPTHAEVVAEYEKRLRQDLADRGLDDAAIAGMLAPPKPAAPAVPARAAARTIDPGAGSTTPTIHGRPTRAQKLVQANVGLKKLLAEEA